MVIKEFQEQMHKVIHRHESAVQDQTCVPNVVAGARTIGGGRAHWRVPPLPTFFRATSGIDWSSIGDWPVMDGKHGSQSQLTIAPHELIQSDFWLSIDWALIFDWAFIGVWGFGGQRGIMTRHFKLTNTFHATFRNFEQIWLTQLRGKKWAKGISFYFPEQNFMK